jgi:hypothetical protein
VCAGCCHQVPSLPDGPKTVSTHGLGKNWYAYCGGHLTSSLILSFLTSANKIIKMDHFQCLGDGFPPVSILTVVEIRFVYNKLYKFFTNYSTDHFSGTVRVFRNCTCIQSCGSGKCLITHFELGFA